MTGKEFHLVRRALLDGKTAALERWAEAKISRDFEFRPNRWESACEDVKMFNDALDVLRRFEDG